MNILLETNFSAPLETEKTALIDEQDPGSVWLFAHRLPGQGIPSSPSESYLDGRLDLLQEIPFYRLEVRRYGVKEQ